MMTRAEMSFCAIAEHSVLSHLDLAKRVVPFKTFTSSTEDLPSNFHARYFGGIAFGTNVFLRCHTDADFTFSIIQVFLKGKSQYISQRMMLLLISVFQLLVLLFIYALVITYCSMQEYLIVYPRDANTKMRYCALRYI